MDELRARGRDVLGTRRGSGGEGLRALDLADRGRVEALLDELRPRAIVNAAAEAAPDRCEEKPEAARAANLEGPKVLAAWCARNGARLIHFSSDLVFDGRAAPYGEEDDPCPLNLYGRLKSESEAEILRLCPGAGVLRVSLVYGRAGSGRPSFMDWVMERLARGEDVEAFSDQWRTPTPCAQLPDVVEGLLAHPELAGIFHWPGAERVSRYEFAVRLCRFLNKPENRVRPSRMADMPGKAARPVDTALRCGRLAQALGLSPLSLEQGFRLEVEARPGEAVSKLK